MDVFFFIEFNVIEFEIEFLLLIEFMWGFN